MDKKHTPAEVAATIRELIKQKYGSLTTYAQKQNITSEWLYSLLNGKEYMSLHSASRFSVEFDLNIDYCTKGLLPVFDKERDYELLLFAATDFLEAVRNEDRAREEYERRHESLSPEEHARLIRSLHKLRIDKIKAERALVDLLNVGWGEETPEDEIEKPVIPKNTMKLHEAIQEVIRQSGQALTFSEIARQINAQKLYVRKDGCPVPASQISARVKNYQQLFNVLNTSPQTVDLK